MTEEDSRTLSGHLDQALDGRFAIRLHPTPLAWLQAGCDGAVVCDDAELRHDRARMADSWRVAA